MENMMIDWKGGYILFSDLEDKYVGGADSKIHSIHTCLVRLDLFEKLVFYDLAVT